MMRRAVCISRSPKLTRRRPGRGRRSPCAPSGAPSAASWSARTGQDHLPAVPGARRLRDDARHLGRVHALLGDAALGAVVGGQLPAPGRVLRAGDDAGVRLAGVRERLALPVLDVEQPLLRARLAEPDRAALAVVKDVRRLPDHEVELPRGRDLDDVEHRPASKRVACDIGIDVEPLGIERPDQFVQLVPARVDDQIEIARGPWLSVSRACERSHDHVRDLGGFQCCDDCPEQSTRCIVHHGAISGSVGHARRNRSSPTSKRYSAILA